MPEHRDAALRRADGDDRRVPFAAGERDHRVDVVDLGAAEVRDAARAAVAAHVERVHGEPLRQVLGEHRELRLGVPAHEAVDEDDGRSFRIVADRAACRRSARRRDVRTPNDVRGNTPVMGERELDGRHRRSSVPAPMPTG